MQKLLNKIVAVIITIMLASGSIMPVMVYATGTVQDAKTSESNVEFNATISGGYNATLNLDEGGTLDLNLKVSGTGYLKDGKVTLENNNYQVDDSAVQGIKSIDGNTIELDEVNTGKMLNVSLPIRLNREESVTKDILGRDSKVTLDAVYVNESGKERTIKKTLTEHVEWTSELHEVVSQSLIRYIKFDENKTMVSFKVSEGIENNKLPVDTKEIVINVPTLEGNKPSNVIVTGKGITYTYENDVITIQKDNAPDSEGKIKWDSQDEYVVTYIYDAQVESTKVESQVVAKAQVKGNSLEAKLDDYTYELKEEVGQYVEAETLGSEEINKGYMYTNIKNKDNNLETTFEVKVKANVGFRDVVDSIKITEKEAMFNNLSAGNSLVNKKIKIDRDNLVDILGENGTVKVLSQDGTELGTLSKDMLEMDINQANISLQTSKVEKEGNIEFTLVKAINASLPYSKRQVQSLTELTTNAVVEGYKGETLSSSKQIARTLKLQEPTSNATIDVNMQNLSTVVKNEDVIITATLKTKDIKDALYTNARLSIVLPKEVKEINIKEAGLIYEDELVLNNLVANNNVISLELNGTQTRYSAQATSEGTVVRIVADITLDNLAPTNDDVITLNYSNEETGESNQVTTSIGIVAPTGFVTTNSLEVNGEKITAQESSEKISRIDVNSSEKEMQISGTIVNNLGHEATGVTVVGTIPASGNRDANDIELGSNFDTKIASTVNVNGIDADILYSDNANEDVNGESWTNNYSDSSKAFKIVAKGTVEQISSMSFNYKVKVPENLQYGNTSKSTYAVYYNNDAEQGQNQNVVLAKAVGVTTGEIPELALESSIVETNTGAQIQNNAQVKESKYITYRLNVKNTGTEVANNIQANVTLPYGIAVVKERYDMSDVPMPYYDMNTKSLTATIDSLKPGETQTLEFRLIVGVVLVDVQDEQLQKQLSVQTIQSQITADKLENAVKTETTINVVKGDLNGYATTNKANKNLKPQDTLDYYVTIANANYDNKQNVKATINLPRAFKVQSVVCNEGATYNYDEGNNTLTYTNPQLSPSGIDGVLLHLVVTDFDSDKQVKITGSVSCDGMSAGEVLNEISYNLTKESISTSLTSNIPEGNLGDTDDLEYYINVTNNTSSKITVSVNDNVPANLRVLGYEIQDANGTRQEETSSRTILETLDINASETARLVIRTVPYTLQKGRVAEIENMATITNEQTTIQSNSLKHKIVGTSESSAGPSTSPDGQPGDGDLDDDVVTKEGTYKVRGTVWIDTNSNGIKELSEEKVSGLTVRLYDSNKDSVAVDVDGKELVTTTNEAGSYTFVNVLPGSYIVVIDIDGQNYGVAPYKVANVSESENSDFVTTKINGKEVAATDEIRVESANIYNIDLGLVRNRIFDLDISKTVTRISVANTKSATKTYNQDNLSVAKVELATANVDYATVLVEYRIAVENKGQVSGYAKSIVDYIPEGMTFNSELNSSWYLGQDGNAYNTSLANTLINPGETKVVTIVLSRKMSADNMGTVRNTAKILMTYNEYGLDDIDSNSEDGQGVEEDRSSADVVIGTATGKEIASFTGIALGILAILGIAIYEIKKHIINKMYNFIERS